jgi:hypothetical protein
LIGSKPKERFRFCKTKTCRKPFQLGRGSSSFCRECTDRREKERREKRKSRRQQLGKYPKGFGVVRKQLDMIDEQCVVCLMNQPRHFQKHGCELEMHHVIMAKVAAQFGDAHQKFNLTPLCIKCHAQARAADEALLRNDWMEWLQASRLAGIPDQVLKAALEGFGIGWQRLPL